MRFKRQHSIGGYITDFYCSQYRLIVEIDGEIHNTKDALEYDAIRDKYFEELEYKTVRISNKEVEENIGDVVEKIKKFLT